MAKAAKSKPSRTRRLYFSAKISDYQFKKVLAHFVLDDTATETARKTQLSVNSVAAIFGKLRVFFTEAGLFTDPGLIGMYKDNEEFERRFLEFHLGRVRDKRGLQSPPGGPDYHVAESHWRFHFYMLMIQRPSENVHAMMLAHLLEIIRICGPVGTQPQNAYQGRLALFRQMDQRLLWLERNAPDFRSTEQRAELRSIASTKPSILRNG